jgi:hypothetical protein
MKFYNIITNSKQFEIDEIIMNMSNTEVEVIDKLYKLISMVEYTNDLGNESMFMISDLFYLSELEYVFNKYSIQFEVVDLTKEVIFDYSFKIKFKNEFKRSVENDILNLIKEYKSDWTTKDDVIDKIIERGIDSLTDFDLDILNN